MNAVDVIELVEEIGGMKLHPESVPVLYAWFEVRKTLFDQLPQAHDSFVNRFKEERSWFRDLLVDEGEIRPVHVQRLQDQMMTPKEPGDAISPFCIPPAVSV